MLDADLLMISEIFSEADPMRNVRNLFIKIKNTINSFFTCCREHLLCHAVLAACRCHNCQPYDQEEPGEDFGYPIGCSLFDLV